MGFNENQGCSWKYKDFHGTLENPLLLGVTNPPLGITAHSYRTTERPRKCPPTARTRTLGPSRCILGPTCLGEPDILEIIGLSEFQGNP